VASTHDFTTTSITGESVDLADYAGKVCLVGKNGEVLERFDPPVTPEDIGEKLAAHL
jgi:glutathione peroxidase-family protein